jgi:pilus assembly protein Flp/PilA
VQSIFGVPQCCAVSHRLREALCFPCNGEETVIKLYSAVRRFVVAEEGATMVEYGLMLALIAVVCLVAVSQVGTGANGMYTSVSASL